MRYLKFFFLIFLFLACAVFAREKKEEKPKESIATELWEELAQKYKLKPEEVKALKELLRKASHDELPINRLIQRIREGVAKRVSYPKMHKAIIQEVGKLKEAKKLIKEYIEKIPIQDEEYAIFYLSELLERGLMESEFILLSSTTTQKKPDLIYTLKQAEALVLLIEKGINRKIVQEIILQATKSNIKSQRTKEIVDLLIKAKNKDLSIRELKENVIKGLKENKDLEWFKEKLKIPQEEPKENKSK